MRLSSSRKTAVLIIGLLLAGAGILYVYEQGREKPVPESPTQIIETSSSLPEQMEDGPPLEELPILSNVPVPENAADLIRIEVPRAGERVRSPLLVSGLARGNWFFEASFPIKVLDKNGTIIGQGHAEAQGEWMTESFVPWKGVIEFTAPASGAGEIVFMKDNPSGLPEYDAEVRVPVVFGP